FYRNDHECLCYSETEKPYRYDGSIYTDWIRQRLFQQCTQHGSFWPFDSEQWQLEWQPDYDRYCIFQPDDEHFANAQQVIRIFMVAQWQGILYVAGYSVCVSRILKSTCTCRHDCCFRKRWSVFKCNSK